MSAMIVSFRLKINAHLPEFPHSPSPCPLHSTGVCERHSPRASAHPRAGLGNRGRGHHQRRSARRTVINACAWINGITNLNTHIYPISTHSGLINSLSLTLVVTLIVPRRPNNGTFYMLVCDARATTTVVLSLHPKIRVEKTWGGCTCCPLSPHLTPLTPPPPSHPPHPRYYRHPLRPLISPLHIPNHSHSFRLARAASSAASGVLPRWRRARAVG